MMLAQLPNYPLRPTSCPLDLYDIIECRRIQTLPHQSRASFRSSYQGESSYNYEDYTLRFRYAKVPWRWSWLKPDERYWNFDNEGLFQREINGAWGIINRSGNPVTPECLDVCREEIDIQIVTGYFDQVAYQWVVCEPTHELLGTRSYEIKRAAEEQLLQTIS